MSEKQFDIFDAQFRNASEQYEPAYSEAAWEKMQAKLDEGNKRRRPAGWLWWLSDALMVSLMLYIAFTFYGNKKQDNSNGDKLTPAAGQTIKKETSRLTQEEKNTGVTTAGTEQNKKEENSTTSPATGNDSSEKTAFKEAITSSAQPGEKTTAVKTITNTTTNKASQDAIGIDNSYNQNLPTPEQNTVKNAVDDDETTLVEKSKIAGKEPAAEGLSLVEKPLANTTDSTLNKQGSTAKKTTSKKSQPASNGFFLHAGLAPELSFVKGNEKGPFKLAYGGGIGYAFSNRWNVQAGVYLTQKKYIAGPTDYKAKPGTYYYNLTIYHVNAVCSITEIPLSVTYNVMQRKRHSIFASAGFSSLIMNKEQYNYHYERMNGAYGNSTYTYHTNNFHLFAATQVSAGYQYKLNNKLSVSASPYIKIPLYGVGEGSVKITSAGMMMGLQYQLPSLKKSKH